MFYFLAARNGVGEGELGMKRNRKELVLVVGLVVATMVFVAASAIIVAARF